DLLRAYAREVPAPDGERRAATSRIEEWYLYTTAAAATLLYPEKTRLPLPARGHETPGHETPGHETPGPQTPGHETPHREVPPARFDDHTGALAWLDAERANMVATIQAAADEGPRATAWLLADALRGYFWLANHSVDWLTAAQAAVA